MNKEIKRELNLLIGDIESSLITQIRPFINGIRPVNDPKKHLLNHCDKIGNLIDNSQLPCDKSKLINEFIKSIDYFDECGACDDGDAIHWECEMLRKLIKQQPQEPVKTLDDIGDEIRKPRFNKDKQCIEHQYSVRGNELIIWSNGDFYYMGKFTYELHEAIKNTMFKKGYWEL